MKSRKWIVGFFTLLSGVVIAFYFSEKSIERATQDFSSVKKANVRKPIPHIVSKQTDSKQTLSSPPDLSIDELSELSKQYLVQCKDPYSFMDDYPEDAGREIQDKILETWSKSNEFKQQLALALIHTNLKSITITGSSPEKKHEYTPLSQLVKDYPNSHLAHYFLVAHCIEQQNCDLSVFDDALAQDPYNGAIWKLIAIRYAAAKEVELALMAIENSASAANFDSYWGETIHLFEQALADTIEVDHRIRQITAIGYSAALALPSFKTLLDFCREHSAQRADIANACLAMGARDFRIGKNLIEQHIGLEIQKLVYEQQNSPLEAQRLESLHQEFRKATAWISTAPNLALHDKDLNEYWWENILLYGESKALELTFAEAVRLSSDPDYNPCPNGKIEPKAAPK